MRKAAKNALEYESYAGIAQLVERNLAKVEVASSNLVSRSKFDKGSTPCFPFSSKSWRDSKAVMHRIANPFSPVRLWVAPPNKKPLLQAVTAFLLIS